MKQSQDEKMVESIRERLEERLNTAIEDGRFDQIADIAEALKRLSDWSPGQDYVALLADLREILGDVMEDLPGTETVPVEKSGTVPVEEANPSEQVPAGEPRTEEVAPAEGEGKASSVAEGKGGGGVAHVEEVKAPEQVPAKDAEAEEGNAGSEEPGQERGSLLSSLGKVPKSEAELTEYIGNLHRVMGDPDVSVEEKDLLQKRLANLEELRNFFDRISEIRQRADRAQRRKDLEDLSGLLIMAKGVQGELKEAKGRLEGGAYELTHTAVRESDALVQDVEEWREKVATEVGLFLTRAKEEERERISDQLADLDKVIRDGVKYVQVDMQLEALKPIAEDLRAVDIKELEGMQLAKPTDLRRLLSRRLLTVCKSEAERLLEEGKKAVEEYNIERAEDRYKRAMEFVQEKRIPSNDPAIVTLKDQLAQLKEKIDDLKGRKERGRDLLDKARAEGKPEEAIRLLRSAEETFPKLVGLDNEKSTRRGQLERHLRQEVKQAISHAEYLAQDREYDEALEVLREMEERLNLLWDVLEYIGLHEKADEFKWEVDRQKAKLQEEWNAWKRFGKIREQVLSDALHSGATVDEARLRERFADVGEYLEKEFRNEWRELQRDLETRVTGRSAYETAMNRFLDNPSDESILDLLGKVDDASLENEVEQLKNSVLAYRAVDELEEEFADSTSGIGTDTWYRRAKNKLQSARRKVDKAIDEDLDNRLKLLEEAIEEVHSLRTLYDEVKSREGYAAAWEQVLSKKDQTLPGEQRGERARNRYRDKGIALILQQIRSEWRKNRLEFIRRRVLQDGDRCSLKSSYRVTTDLKKAIKYVNEMEKYHVLHDLEDSETVSCVRRLWYEVNVGTALGLKGWPLDVEELMERVNAVPVGRQWEELLSYLDALRNMRYSGVGISPEEADELYRVALIRFAISGKDDTSVVQLLQAQRKRSPYLYSDPVLCGLLAIRYAVSPEDNSHEIQALADELGRQGGLASEVHDIIEKVVRAKRYKAENRWIDADKQMEEAIDKWMEIVKGGNKELPSALGEVKNIFLKQWRKDMCEQMFEDLADCARRLDDERIFEQLQKALDANQLCHQDDRSRKCLNELAERAREVTETLSEEASMLLDGRIDNLDDAIKTGEQLLTKLENVVGVWNATSSSRMAELKRFVQQKEEVENWLESLRSARDRVRKAKSMLVALLDGVWYWNNQTGMDPLKTLNNVQRLMRKAREDTSGRVPEEARQLLKLVKTLTDASQELGKEFGELKLRFESDEYRNVDDLGRALEDIRKLKDISSKYQSELRRVLLEMGWGDVRLRVDKFFMVYDEYAKCGTGHSAETGVVAGLDEIEECMELRYDNAARWQRWTEATVGILGEAQGACHNARKYLKGHLGKSRSEGKKVVGSIAELERRMQNMPPAPVTKVALKEARSIRDLDFDLDSDAPEGIRRNLQRLRSADRDEILNVWKALLKEEIDWMKVCVGELEEKWAEREKQLSDILEKIAKHLKHNRRPTKRSQDIFKELLDQARKIDVENTMVIDRERQYHRRERQLGREE